VVAPRGAAQLTARSDVSAGGRYVWHGISRAAGLVAQPSLAVELQRQLNADLQSALAATGAKITNEFRSQLNGALAGVVDASMAESQRQLGEFIQAFDRAREEDRRIVLSWIEKNLLRHLVQSKTLEQVA